MHSKDFHDNIDILDGFEFYDRNVDCRLPNCPSNKVNRHFHCTRSSCNYSFVQYSTMAIHNQKHMEEVNHFSQILPPQMPNEIKIKNEPISEDRNNEVNAEHQTQLRAMNLSQNVQDNKVSGKF